MTTDGDEWIRVSDTGAENVHGNTAIRPGDRVEFERRLCRVVEVYPEKSKLLVLKTGGVHSALKRIHVEAITRFEPREGSK